jgi:hypothetical protein
MQEKTGSRGKADGPGGVRPAVSGDHISGSCDESPLSRAPPGRSVRGFFGTEVVQYAGNDQKGIGFQMEGKFHKITILPIKKRPFYKKTANKISCFPKLFVI